MAACHPTGRLWTEIHNLPSDYIWMLIEHSPAASSMNAPATLNFLAV